MADIAWVELHVFDRIDGVIHPETFQENSVQSYGSFRPTARDDFRLALGIKSRVTLTDGTRFYATETKEEIDGLVKAKVR